MTRPIDSPGPSTGILGAIGMPSKRAGCMLNMNDTLVPGLLGRHATNKIDKTPRCRDNEHSQTCPNSKSVGRPNAMMTENDRDALVDFLARHVDTQILTHAEVSAFLNFCDFEIIQRNRIIADIGEVGESIYFLLEGTAELIVGPTTNEVPVGQIHAGEMLGEMSFFDRQPRNVRMRARSAVRLLRLPRVKYNRLRLEHPVFTVLLLEYAIVSLDHLYRRTSTDVAQLNQYIHSMGG